jgi:hypothetical protein
MILNLTENCISYEKHALSHVFLPSLLMVVIMATLRSLVDAKHKREHLESFLQSVVLGFAHDKKIHTVMFLNSMKI